MASLNDMLMSMRKERQRRLLSILQSASPSGGSMQPLEVAPAKKSGIGDKLLAAGRAQIQAGMMPQNAPASVSGGLPGSTPGINPNVISFLRSGGGQATDPGAQAAAGAATASGEGISALIRALMLG